MNYPQPRPSPARGEGDFLDLPPQGGGRFLKASPRTGGGRFSLAADADAGIERVEDDAGSWLGKEVGRLLGHHPARLRDGDHVRNRWRPQQEGGRSRAVFDPVEQSVAVAGVTEVALLLHLCRLQAEFAFEDRVMQDRNVKPRDGLRTK